MKEKKASEVEIYKLRLRLLKRRIDTATFFEILEKIVIAHKKQKVKPK